MNSRARKIFYRTNIKTTNHSKISLLLGESVSVPIYDLDQQVKIWLYNTNTINWF